jgi:hypothetical protein
MTKQSRKRTKIIQVCNKKDCFIYFNNALFVIVKYGLPRFARNDTILPSLRAIENGAAIHFFLSFSATQFRHCEECKA